MLSKKIKLNNPTSLKLRRTSAKPRVAIGMSGGVDSSVAAKLLLDQGYEVVGFMMKLWPGSETRCTRDNACCDIEGLEDAKRIAAILKIPFYVVDVREKFKEEVADYFIEEYKNLRTPNPCVKCNEKIKFGWLLDFAKSVGCDYLATGHYARIASDLSFINSQFLLDDQLSYEEHLSFRPKRRNLLIKDPSTTLGMTEKVIYHLLKGKDESKDQSYFLYRLTQDQLKHVLFPVGEYKKEETRAMAKKWGLPVHEKKESQEICFIQEKDYREFLRKNISDDYFKPGDIADLDGNLIGRHNGLINYTIGQRRGIEQSVKLEGEDKKALYTIGFNLKDNRLIVGNDQDVYKNEMTIGDVHFINSNLKSRISKLKNLTVKIRYRHPAVNCTITGCHPELPSGLVPAETDVLGFQGDGMPKRVRHDILCVQFDEPQRAITPGQSAVFYDGEEVLGGGVILS